MPDVSLKTEVKSDALIELRRQMTEGNFDEARQIERDAVIPTNIVMSIVNSVFDGMLMNHQYTLAIEMGRRYNLSDDKISDPGLLRER